MGVFVQAFCWTAQGALHREAVFDSELTKHDSLSYTYHLSELTRPVASLLLWITNEQSNTENQSMVRSIIIGKSFSRPVAPGEWILRLPRPGTPRWSCGVHPYINRLNWREWP